ncbi:STAS domain-containing protein [Pseudonocardia sp. T1-2H]|uniref:STAS domain-containing protein n=1 Tax=Pseudonocardia sp. T1-2H TaxID=3128899 RepID=UPI0031012DA1
MRTPDRVQLAVETPSAGFRLIRVAGALGVEAAARLVRLADLQLQVLGVVGVARHTVGHLLVDLAGVGHFGPGAVETLRHVRHTAARAGIGVHLTGCGGRLTLLPVRVRQVLTEFSTFPSVEEAVAELDGHAGIAELGTRVEKVRPDRV